MKVDNLTINRVFSGGGDVHYVLPHFQREYTWGQPEWQTLWNDTLAVYEEFNPDKLPEHFLGSLVVVDAGTTDGVIPVFTLVDGQQRLTTISLLLFALLETVKTRPESQQLTSRLLRLLFNDAQPTRDVYLKLLPTTKYQDRITYRSLITGQSVDFSSSESNIPKAFAFFRRECSKYVANNIIDAEQLYRVVNQCFQVVFINLTLNESPYRIFESLNAKGKPLTQADLVRNYIAMKLPYQRQEEIFTSDWQQIEIALQEKRTVGRLGELTAFIRHYLAMHSETLCNEGHIYARFRDRMEKDYAESEAFVNEIKLLHRFAGYYQRFLRPENEPRDSIRERLEQLAILETTSAYPFLLTLFDAQDHNVITEPELLEALAILENYFVRRYLTGEQANYLAKMFPTLWIEVQKSGFPFIAALRSKLAAKRYPTNQQIYEDVSKRRIYNQAGNFSSARLYFVLEQINRHLSQGTDAYTVLKDKPTIEHIMPQTLSEEWRRDLGENADQIQIELGDTLGNLTLGTQNWNSKISNSPFAVKVQALATHGLRLNDEYFAQHDKNWDAVAIRERANFLAAQILEIWPSIGVATETQQVQIITKPRKLTIRDESFEVKLWREVIYHVAEYGIRQRKFDIMRQVTPTYLLPEAGNDRPDTAWALLSNHWYVRVYMSGATQFCRRILTAIGVGDDEWSIEEEVIGTNGNKQET